MMWQAHVRSVVRAGGEWRPRHPESWRWLSAAGAVELLSRLCALPDSRYMMFRDRAARLGLRPLGDVAAVEATIHVHGGNARIEAPRSTSAPAPRERAAGQRSSRTPTTKGAG